MNRLTRTAIAIAAMIALPLAVEAADLRRVINKAPPPEPLLLWSGGYIGINAGGSIGRNRTTDNGVYSAAIVGPPITLYNETFTHSPVGMIAGAQVGYNMQVSPQTVLGFEADWQWSGQKEVSCVFACGATTTAFFGPGGAGFNNALADEHRLRWLATARARFGYATTSWLWYLTGGAAWGQVQSNLSLTSSNIVAALFVPGTAEARFSRGKLGWTVGAGVETQLWGGMSAKLEYLYVDLGNFSNSFTIVGGPTLPGSAFTTTTSYRFTDHIIRAGLNYRFY